MPHGDYTGQQKAALAAKFAEQQRQKALQMSMVSAAVAEVKTETLDLTDEISGRPVRETEGINLDDPDGAVVYVDFDDPQWEAVEFRCSDTVEHVTIGKDNTFNFTEGQKYKVPRWIYQHLDEKGLVYH